ncbi:MAG: DUF3043 domain-containing protein [Streptosporangiaceae bacterium]
MFRRGNAGARGGTAQDDQGAQSPGGPQATTTAETARSRPAAEAAKGRPTPKRSEAERGRRQGITGTTAGRSRGGSGGSGGGGGGRPTSKEDRLRRTEAMRRGEEWALSARDRGPVKALVRDYVDSRRRISEYYMYVMLVLVVLLFIRVPAVQRFAEPIVLVLIVFVIVDALLLRMSLKRLIAQRLPGESTRGMTTYAVFRALQIRRFRMPPPRITPGTKV